MKSLISLFLAAIFAANPVFANTSQKLAEQAEINVENLTDEDLKLFVNELDSEVALMLKNIASLKQQIAEQRAERAESFTLSLKATGVTAGSLVGYVTLWRMAFDRGIRGDYGRVTRGMDVAQILLLSTAAITAGYTIVKLAGITWTSGEILLLENKLENLEAKLSDIQSKVQVAKEQLK